MNGASRGTDRADASFSGDFLDLVAEDCTLNMFDDPLPIFEAQPKPLWEGDPLGSRHASKLMSAILPLSKVVSIAIRTFMAVPLVKSLP